MHNCTCGMFYNAKYFNYFDKNSEQVLSYKKYDLSCAVQYSIVNDTNNLKFDFPYWKDKNILKHTLKFFKSLNKLLLFWDKITNFFGLGICTH